MRSRRDRRDIHGLDASGMLLCNPRDREAAHRAQVAGIATESLASVTCRKCRKLMYRSLREVRDSKRPLIRYVELKSGYDDNGPAWIARVKLSKTGRTVYFGRKALHRAVKGGIAGNHFDFETGEEYWVSGVKKRGNDRHWAGSGFVMIERSAVAEYLREVGATKLDATRFVVVPDLPEPDPSQFDSIQHRRLYDGTNERKRG